MDEHFIAKYMTRRDRRETPSTVLLKHHTPYQLSLNFTLLKIELSKQNVAMEEGFDVPVPACTFLFLGEYSLNI